MMFWAILTLIIFLIEISTMGAFFTFFFVISAGFMIFFERFFDNIYLELGIFSVVSIVLTFILRPLLIKHFGINKVIENSNLDAFLEKEGLVIEEIIENDIGKIKVGYEIWNAKSDDGITISKDTRVSLIRIDGNTIFVKARSSII